MEPRIVAVAPRGLDGVVAHEREVYEPRLVRRQLGVAVEPAREPRLAAAVRAWAQPAQRHRVVHRLVTVRPFEAEGPGGPVGVDAVGSGPSVVLQGSILLRARPRTDLSADHPRDHGEALG